MKIPVNIKSALKTISNLFLIATKRNISFEMCEHPKKKGYVEFTIFENKKIIASLCISAKELKAMIEGMNLYLTKQFLKNLR